MKQMQKTKAKVQEKDDYKKLSFLFPVIYSILTAILMISALYIVYSGADVSVALAGYLMNISALSLAISPSALIVCVFLGTKHRQKHPNGSSFYRQCPLVLSFLVEGLQVLYMVSLAMAM